MADNSQITCTICRKPIDLKSDLYTDGDGKAVHENCYAKKIADGIQDHRKDVGNEGAA